MTKSLPRRRYEQCQVMAQSTLRSAAGRVTRGADLSGCRSTRRDVDFSKKGVNFSFQKTIQIPSKSAYFDQPAIFNTPIIHNLYAVILIFFGFFPVDPLPTRVFCRNTAKK